ncbi:NOF-FB transposable element protein, partial [Aphis craccivora]
MKVNEQTFTVLSMLSEEHDNISIRVWIQRWLRCGVQSPKVVICDQSLALMSALVQSFTQFTSLEMYLDVCMKLTQGQNCTEIPFCYVRNDVNHFMHLVAQWPCIKNTKFTRTKQLYIRAIGLLVLCTNLTEAKTILEAIFTIAFSETDGLDEHGERTLCAESKIYLKNRITANVIDFVDPLIEINQEENISPQNDDELDNNESMPISNISFKEWTKSIANECQLKVDLGIKGIEDNVQYELEIVPHIINAMKLFPCWSGIMRPLFGYGSETASSSRIESNFNNLKHRVFHNDVLPLRVDTFLEKIIQYYRGDHLLLQGSTQNIDEREKYDDIINEDNENDIELGEYGNHEVEEDHEDSADDEIRIDHGDDIGQLVNCERDSNLIAQRPSNSCLACSNGDFPTGLHKCKICQTNVHLFGCSVPATGTEEGCGEERLCLICADIAVENNATEKWGK